jgi:hypothetical protein
MTSGTQFDIVQRDRASQNLPGDVFEDAVLDALDMGKTISVASQDQTSLVLEVAPYDTIKEWLGRCRTKFAREMAYGLVTSAIHSYDNGDLDGLGQAVVDWTSTLELEADRKVVRRMRRRGRRDQLGNRTTVHDRP